jgi:D,D-heptose 1,7-bisphosphate phosphatase
MESNKAVFIDLQGTLGGEGKGDIMNFEFYPFAYEAIRKLNNNGYLSIIITNQAHISKGYFTYEDYNFKVGELKSKLLTYGVHIDGIYCCPHMPKDNCSCMKPLPGMIEKAIIDFNIDRSSSYIVGDMGDSDMLLAKNTMMRGVLVRTGGGNDSLSKERHTWATYEPYNISNNILEAVNFILRD